MDRERTIEFLIGFAFLILLILIIVIVLNVGGNPNKNNSKTSAVSSGETTINNYYENNYNYPEKSISGNVVYKYENGEYVVYKGDTSEKVVYKYENGNYIGFKEGNEKIAYVDEPPYFKERTYTQEDYGEYSSEGIHKKIKNSFSYVDEYRVYVKNEDSVGKLFKVVFYFNAQGGFQDSQGTMKYIGPGETKEFFYKDVHFEKFHYDAWDYAVFSQDDGFKEELY